MAGCCAPALPPRFRETFKETFHISITFCDNGTFAQNDCCFALDK
jgi:hypothetical protein